MRDVFVHPQLEALGIDHDQPDVVWRRAVEDAGQHGVQADRLAGAGGPGDEQVRHRRHVGDEGLAVDRLAERDRELRRRSTIGLGFEQLAQRNLLAEVVGHLDADGGLAGQPIDQDRLGLKREAQVVGEAGNLAVLHARIGLELERRDDRARMNLDHAALDRELAALFFQQPRTLHQLALVDLSLGLRRVEERQRRQGEPAHPAFHGSSRRGVDLVERQRWGHHARRSRPDGAMAGGLNGLTTARRCGWRLDLRVRPRGPRQPARAPSARRVLLRRRHGHQPPMPRRSSSCASR